MDEKVKNANISRKRVKRLETEREELHEMAAKELREGKSISEDSALLHQSRRIDRLLGKFSEKNRS